MPTICARGGKSPSAAALSFHVGFAVCPLRLSGVRHYHARDATEDVPLRPLLLRTLCGLDDRAELGDVFDRAVAPSLVEPVLFSRWAGPPASGLRTVPK